MRDEMQHCISEQRSNRKTDERGHDAEVRLRLAISRKHDEKHSGQGGQTDDESGECAEAVS